MLCVLGKVMDADGDLQVWNCLNDKKSAKVSIVGRMPNLSLKIVGEWSFRSKEVNQGEGCKQERWRRR